MNPAAFSQYHRKPSRIRTSNPMYQICRLKNRYFSVRVWVPGSGLRYVGCYRTFREAVQAREEARREYFS